MKKMFLAAALIGATVASAAAADMGTRTYTKAPMMAPVAGWTGVYVGAHVGGAFTSNSYNDFGGGLTTSIDQNGFLGGGQIGLNYQIQNWVLGLEGDVSGLSRLNRTYAFPGSSATVRGTEWLASVTGRLGYAMGSTLVYAKGGVAFQDSNLGYLGVGLLTPDLATRKDVGYTVGAGIEHKFAPSWSAKLEYQYYDFGRARIFSNAPAEVVNYRDDIHTVKVGVNYHLNAW